MTLRSDVIAGALFAAWATIACARSSANNPPPAAPATVATEDEPTAGVMEHHQYHHHGGVALFVAMSLDTLGVSSEQRVAVEKIQTDLRAKMEPARVAEQNLLATLADGVATAQLDASKVDAEVSQMTAAAAAVHEASIDAFNQLHAVLTPAQRAALVDKVESHWAVWQKANAEKTGQESVEGDRLTTLATDLGLTPEQLAMIRSRLGEGSKGQPGLDTQQIATHVRAFGDAFRGETFDARALTTASGANAHLVGWGAAQLARLVETAIPVLTPDQRAKFTLRLREHATHDPSVP